MDNKRRVVIDTREQRPYSFEGALHKKLEAGDYSIEGFEDRIAIERKSLEDWIGTVLHSKRRFRAELLKLQSYEFAAIVIEGSLEDITLERYRSDVNPRSLKALSNYIQVTYHPVIVFYASDRPHAYEWTADILRFLEEKYGSQN